MLILVSKIITGITISPVVGKVYEKLVIFKFETHGRKKKIIVETQGASQESCSSLHTSWLLRETISYNVERQRAVLVSLLDIKKAFDTVWINGLLYRLYEMGVNGKLWRIIKAMYDWTECCMKIGNSLSELFQIFQGVHQGAPMSMLFQMYINPLLQELRESNLGARIGNINVTCPAFVDDIAIVSLSKRSLQEMINIAYKFSCKWRFKFSANKVMLWLSV